jgi:hypothetical protein
MTRKEKLLAASLLELASEEFSNHGCNDWEFPVGWSPAECHDFVRRYCDWNGDPSEYDASREPSLPDWAVMRFLAAKIEEEVTTSEVAQS